ncbi:hypothetical protein ABZ772_31690, partial [Streptomyces griseoincarnatus]
VTEVYTMADAASRLRGILEQLLGAPFPVRVRLLRRAPPESRRVRETPRPGVQHVPHRTDV